MALRRLFLGCFGASSTRETVVDGTEPKPKPAQSTAVPWTSKQPLVESDKLSEESSDSINLSPSQQQPTPTKALCVIAKHTYDLSSSIPYPSLNTPDEIMIQVKSVGLNPIDWKSVDYNFCMPSFPWIGGREASGVVVEVGSNVKDFKVGDRIWTSTYYRDRRAGTFQEYCVVPQHTVLPLPDGSSFESGACLGVAALTAAMTLWKWLGVPMPQSGLANNKEPQISRPEYLLVWGGSTITGQFAIQLAKQSGLRVVAVTSEKTKVLAETLGARHVLTRDGRTNDEIVQEIRQITGDDLTMAIDIVGNSTGACCLKALSTSKPAVLAPLAFLKEGETVPENVSIAPIEMKRFIIEEGNRKYAEELNRLVGNETVVLPQLELLHGLEKVQEGLDMLKRGDMNGRKLVVKIA